MTIEVSGSVKSTPVDAAVAREIASGFLAEEVGDLLMAGDPHMASGLWVMPIIAGNAVQGELGQVGVIRVDAATGKVLFSEDDRTEVKAGARRLAAASSP